jgi:hypothetical protein
MAIAEKILNAICGAIVSEMWVPDPSGARVPETYGRPMLR